MKNKAFLISEKHIICSFSLELYRVFYFFLSGLKSYDDWLWYEFVSIHCTGPSQSRNNLNTKICSSVSLLMISFVHISLCLSSMLIFWASESDPNFLVISLTFSMHLLFFTLHLGCCYTFNFQNFFYNFYSSQISNSRKFSVPFKNSTWSYSMDIISSLIFIKIFSFSQQRFCSLWVPLFVTVFYLYLF